MENYVGITSFLRDKIIAEGGDPARETLGLVYTTDGKPFYTDSNGKVWRLVPFIENTDCYQSATPELFEASARTFGRFQYMLKDYPAATLHETIVKFHDTEDRYNKFLAALEADKVGRAKDVQAEIDFVVSRKADCSVALQALRDGILPLRVTHNDTKLNNVLLDNETHKPLCVLDLDTVMPGLSAHDFGDSIRFGAATAAEDEPDPSKMKLDLHLFEVYTRGYLEGATKLTEREVAMLPMGALVITLELATRFLKDYLDGDLYFKTAYPEHNLVRARNMFKMVTFMEQNRDKLDAIVAKYR